MARPGRKRKSGTRYASGDLVRTPRIDRGTPELQLQRAKRMGRVDDEIARLWSVGRVDEAAAAIANDTQQGIDAVGRAWVAGLLIAETATPEAMRDAGRVFGGLYWRHYAALNPGGGLFGERVSRGSVASLRAEMDWDTPDPLEDALNKRMAAIELCGRDVTRAVRDLCLGEHLNGGPTWLDRLIIARRDDSLVDTSDWAMMRWACVGLAAIV
jgi:hypothetical protein